MARPPRDPRQRLDRAGDERPLLQGHLRPGGKPPVQPTTAGGLETDDGPSAQPGREGAVGEAAAERGKATRGPAETATRRHLEGSEQGPV